MKISKVFVGSFLAWYLLLGVCNVLSVSSYYAFSAGIGEKALEYLLILLFDNMGHKLLTAGLFSIAAAFGVHAAACMRGAPRGKGKKVLPKAGAEESRGLAG